MKKFSTAYFFAAALIGAGCESLPDETVSASTADGRSQQTITAAANDGREFIPGQYIVVLNDNIAPGAVESVASEMAAQHSAAVDKVFKNALKGFVARMSAQQAEKLARNPNVKYVEQDQVMRIDIKAKPGSGGGGTTGQRTDWGISRVGGSADGTGKVAWIIDSGIDLDHPDLNVDVSRSRHFTGTSPEDENGHGTHVAGIVAAKNNTTGVIGVASGATVVAVRVLNRQGSGTYSGIIAGVNYVAATANPGDVANMSLGGGFSQALNDAVIALGANGVKVTLAAGNESTSATTKSPASANGTNLYTISAYDSGNRFASFSNYGNPPIEYAAPGVNILSLWKNGGTNTISGTSMAAPYAAGVLLLGDARSVGQVTGDRDNNPDQMISR